MAEDIQYNIPIWDDNPTRITATNGLTPYGYYDNDTIFQDDAYRFSKFAARRLGYPIVDIELQDINFYTAFEDAINEYANQVNQFNIRNNIYTLKGLPTSSITDGNLSQKYVSPNLGSTVGISQMYGQEANLNSTVPVYTASISVTQGQSKYDLVPAMEAVAGEGDYEVRRVFHHSPPAIVKYFDPYAGSALSMNNMISSFGWQNFSPAINFMMMPMYGDILRLQAIEFNDMIRKSAYSFDIQNNVIELFPIPVKDYTLYFRFIRKTDRQNPFRTGTYTTDSEGKRIYTGDGVISDFSNIPYQAMTYGEINHPGKQWIRDYALATAMDMLGNVRGKYQQIPATNESVTLDGDDLRSRAENMKDRLLEQLREMLETTTGVAQLEREQQKAEFLREVLNSIPLKIYVG